MEYLKKEVIRICNQIFTYSKERKQSRKSLGIGNTNISYTNKKTKSKRNNERKHIKPLY